MDLLWFRDLAALSRTGNFSRAAIRANISQPAFSRRIQALEAWVGTPLVDRSTHPVAITYAGSRMLEAGEQALQHIETVRDQIREALAQPDRYVVTFAAQHSIGWRFYPTWLQDFETAFGPILTRLRADNLQDCVEALLAGDVDFVISYESDCSSGIDRSGSLQSLTIGRDRLIPVCRPAPDGRPLFDIDDTTRDNIPYLRFGPTAPIGHHVEPLLRVRGLERRLSVVYENTMSGALRIRARDGNGVAWLPETLVQPDLDLDLLTLAGSQRWYVNLDVRLHRCAAHVNQLTQDIWAYLSAGGNATECQASTAAE